MLFDFWLGGLDWCVSFLNPLCEFGYGIFTCYAILDRVAVYAINIVYSASTVASIVLVGRWVSNSP